MKAYSQVDRPARVDPDPPPQQLPGDCLAWAFVVVVVDSWGIVVAVVGVAAAIAVVAGRTASCEAVAASSWCCCP